jgi:hypothetical protein
MLSVARTATRSRTGATARIAATVARTPSMALRATFRGKSMRRLVKRSRWSGEGATDAA